MRRPMLLLLAVASAFAPLASCGGGSDDEPASRAAIEGRQYVATAVSDPGRVPEPALVTVTFGYDGIALTGGCNEMGSDYVVEDSRLRLTRGLSTTQVGCGPQREGQDTWIGDLFDAPVSVELHDDGQALELSRGSQSVSLSLMGAKDGPAPLEDVQWTARDLGGLVIAGPMVKPALKIDDGEATIFTGCNSATAPVKVTVGRVDFGRWEQATERACPGYIGRIDRHVRATLTGKVQVEFRGPRAVTLFGPRDHGLSLVRR